MTSTSRSSKRATSIAVAAALAGALATPALAAFAADPITTVQAPTVTDGIGWENDTYTIPVTQNVTWKVKIGTATEKDASGSSQKIFTEKPGSSSTTLVFTPSATTGNTLGPDVKPVTLKVTNVAAKTVTPKAPTAVLDKASNLYKNVSIPYVAGVKYTVDGKAVDQSSKKAVSVAATKTDTTVKAEVESASFLLDTTKPVITEWVLDTQTANRSVSVKVSDLVKGVDGLGTKDTLEITGLNGVLFTVGTGKPFAVKEGTVKKVSVKAATTPKVTVKAEAATGYALAEGSVTTGDFTFTPLTLTDVKSNITVTTAGVVTLKAHPAIKSWKLGKSTITFPKNGTQVTFALPAGDTLVATPASGYALETKGDTAGKTDAKGALSVTLAKGTAFPTAAGTPGA